jgi:pimeloyl-ACP methyl ester carboxylesterase
VGGDDPWEPLLGLPPQIDTLSTHGPVVRIDVAEADDVAAVIEALDLVRPLVIGWGAGGQAALARWAPGWTWRDW